MGVYIRKTLLTQADLLGLSSFLINIETFLPDFRRPSSYLERIDLPLVLLYEKHSLLLAVMQKRTEEIKKNKGKIEKHAAFDICSVSPIFEYTYL